MPIHAKGNIDPEKEVAFKEIRDMVLSMTKDFNGSPEDNAIMKDKTSLYSNLMKLGFYGDQYKQWLIK